MPPDLCQVFIETFINIQLSCPLATDLNSEHFPPNVNLVIRLEHNEKPKPEVETPPNVHLKTHNPQAWNLLNTF